MPETSRLQVDIPSSVKKRLDQAARKRGTTLKALVNSLLARSEFGDPADRLIILVWFIAFPSFIGALALLSVVAFEQSSDPRDWVAYCAFGLVTIQTVFFARGLFHRDMGTKLALAAASANAVAIIFVCARIYQLHGFANSCVAECPSTGFSEALYFSIVTWTTLGYGDLQPRESLQLLAACQAVLGYLYLGLVVGLLGAIANQAVREPTQE